MAPCTAHTRRGLPASNTLRAQAWRAARLERCPNHPHGGCSVRTPRHLRAQGLRAGRRIARWYCRESNTTFSLLPDCLAARFPGELDDPRGGGGPRRAGPEPGRRGQCAAPRYSRAPGGDALGRAPGASRPSRPDDRHRATARTARPVHRRDGRGAHAARDRGPRCRALRARSSPSSSRCCPHRWGSTLTVSARRIATQRPNTTWGLTRRLSPA